MAPNDRSQRRDMAAVGGLCLLILFAFWRIGPAGRVLAEGDLFTYFYPYWAEATRAIRAGRLPLWNPNLFMGVPFLANSQAGVLYPLNWLLWLLLPAHRALHWSIIVHLWLAAAGAYVYARSSLGLGRLGAWAAGASLALGGYLGAQVEHINQLQALAWFPWLLALFDLALKRPGGLAFAGLAATVGMTLLAGHTQSAFIVLMGLAVVALAAAVGARPGTRSRPYRKSIILWAGAVALGAALAAVQLVPTLELTRLSTRAGGLPFNERVSFSLSPLYLARALLPAYGQAVEPAKIEFVATMGVTGLLLLLPAGCSLWQRIRNRDHVSWGILFLAAAGLFLAFGLYNPVYHLLARFVPGFAHFRAPARWLALWTFAGSALVGLGIDRLAHKGVRLSRRAWIAGGAALAGCLIWGIGSGQTGLLTVGGWLAAAILASAMMWLSRRRRKSAAVGLIVLLAGELILAAQALPHARATAAAAYTSLRPAGAHLLASGQDRRPPDRFLSLSALVFDPGDLAELHTIYDGQLSPDALYSLIVATKHREVLSPNLPLAVGVAAVDGYDGGLLPLARYRSLQQAFLPEAAISLDGRLRENLEAVPDGRWLSLLNVRYVITDKVFDAWLDDVFYDLQFSARMEAGEVVEVADVPSFQATALGMVSYLDGAATLPDGTPVGEITLGFAGGATQTFTLRAGQETAEGIYGPDVAHAQAPVGGHFWPGQPEGNDYAVRLRWAEPGRPISITVRATLPEGVWTVRGLSLIDERTGSFQSLVLSDQGHFRLAHSGDVKVYENLQVLPRAFVVHQAQAAGNSEQALASMRAPDFDPTRQVVVESPDPFSASVGPTAETVQIVAYEPERIEIVADLAAPGYLVLTDAAYPGWRVRVDGRTSEILVADLLFRAVALEEGEHRILFTFAPTSVWIGGGFSLAGLGVLIGLLAIPVYNRRRRHAPEGDA